MVSRRKLRFVNFGLRIILTCLKIQNGRPANTSQNLHVGSVKFAIHQAKIEPLKWSSEFQHSILLQFDCFISLVSWAFSLKIKLSDYTHI